MSAEHKNYFSLTSQDFTSKWNRNIENVVHSHR